MENSRTAFLLARFLGLTVWINGLIEATYALDRLLAIGAYRATTTRHYYFGLLVFLVGRVLLDGIVGAVLWTQAARVGKWMEGRPSAETREDAPPLPHP